MAKRRKARKAGKKLLPLNRCMKSKGKCFKIVKKGGRRTIKGCRCTSATPSKTKVKGR